MSMTDLRIEHDDPFNCYALNPMRGKLSGQERYVGTEIIKFNKNIRYRNR